jgi:hypothetical protein
MTGNNPLSVPEDRAAEISRCLAQFFLNTEQLVVFCYPVGAAGRAGLQICPVFSATARSAIVVSSSFAGAVTDNRRVAAWR